MIKILNLFLAISLIFATSCRSGDSNDNTTPTKIRSASATIGGNAKNYNVLSVSKYTGTKSGILITASVNGSASDNFQFIVYDNQTGNDAFSPYSVEFYNNGVLCIFNFAKPLLVNVTENSTTRLKGTFSGNIYTANATYLTVENGVFQYDY